MDEEKEKTEEVQEGADTPKEEGIQSSAVSELDRADSIAERQKRENDRREKLLEREESLEARRAVGGVTEGGKPAEKKEETPAEYSTRVMKNE